MDANEKHAGEGSDSFTCDKSLVADIPKPPSIEDFVVLKPISRGAFGKVYLSRKKSNGRLYAVKVMKKADMADKNMRGQMKAERDALALSKSPFVVHLFYSLQTATKIYLVMEYLIGGDVKSLLHIYGYFDQDMAVRYISEVALALDYLHRHGITHRDLKPDNMLVSNKGHIKLTDFGLSKVKLDRELSLADILTTPSLAKPMQDYFRTPGQVLSLISSLGFSSPVIESKRHHGSALGAVTPMSCTKSERRKIALCSPRVTKENLFSAGCSSRNRGLNSCAFSPYTLAKNLTPCLLKSRNRCETLSAASSRFYSVSDSEGDVSPLWESDQKENEQNCEKKKFERAWASETRGGMATPEPKMLGRDCAFKSMNFESPAVASRGGFEATADEKQKRTKPDTLTGKRFRFDKKEPPVSTKDGIFLPATDGSRNATASSAKRMFSDVERSPEPLEIQPKKSNVEYKRCFEIPEESAGLHTGLTGVFSVVQVEDPGPPAERSGSSEGDQVPRPSSPSAVTKNLLCELEEPTEDVFIDGAKDVGNSSFREDHKLTRTLSFDSEGSVHEMSIVANSPAAQNPSRCSGGNSTSPENSISPLPRTPGAANVDTLNPSSAFQRDKLKTSVLDKLPELACSVTKSPSFLKPRNVVMFRSYCSAIERSNVSWNSHFSLGSVEAMDVSASASYHNLHAAITPVQKTPASHGSYQTPQAMMTSHSNTPFRTPKSVRRGALPVERAPIQGTPDYLAPELLLGKSHDFRVDWWALGVCLFEFLTGVPPFNDETPQLVFQNILNRDIPWPDEEEELSDSSRNAIEILLTMDMTKRAGLKELRGHPLFEGLDWDNLQDQPMPFIPQPEDETDTSYFEARNNAQHLHVSDFSL